MSNADDVVEMNENVVSSDVEGADGSDGNVDNGTGLQGEQDNASE